MVLGRALGGLAQGVGGLVGSAAGGVVKGVRRGFKNAAKEERGEPLHMILRIVCRSLADGAFCPRLIAVGRYIPSAMRRCEGPREAS